MHVVHVGAGVPSTHVCHVGPQPADAMTHHVV